MQEVHIGQAVTTTAIRNACRYCGVRELCLPLGLGSEDLKRLDQIVKRQRTLKKGEALYRVGDPLQFLYAIRHGSFKATSLMEDGRVQISGFYLPGELLGIDAINADRHPCTAEALEPAEVCEVSFTALGEVSRQVPGLQRQLLRIVSGEIIRDEHSLMMLGCMSAQERLAACLVSLSRRAGRLDDDGPLGGFRLSMSRQDLGDYLGLALETVSRLFSHFQHEGLIELHGRNVTIRDAAGLEGRAGRA